jgi:hypothetical protein
LANLTLQALEDKVTRGKKDSKTRANGHSSRYGLPNSFGVWVMGIIKEVVHRMRLTRRSVQS